MASPPAQAHLATEDVVAVSKSNDEDLKIEADQASSSGSTPAAPVAPARPPMDYSSFSAFTQSFSARWKSIWTRRYFTLFAVYTPYTIFKYGFKGWGKMILRDGWKYFILGACDVEANFLVIKAYQYTDLLSCMLLDAWAIPVCMFFSWLYLRVRYHWTQLLGVAVCIAGLALVVVSDIVTNKGWDPIARGKGDAFMIAGATLYGFTNATEEFLVRKRPLYEVLGQLGMWAFLINGIQASAMEWKQMTEVPWTGDIIGLLLAFTAAMLILYTVAPLIYRMASSAFFNLSLLSADFYGLLFGLFLYRYAPYWLYFIAFVVILSGLVVYFWHSTPEEQGVLDPRRPDYLESKSEGPIDEELGLPAVPKSDSVDEKVAASPDKDVAQKA